MRISRVAFFYVVLAGLYSDTLCQTWQPIAPMLQPRMEFRAIQLNNGKILVAGGEGAWTDCELYDPVSDKWTATGSLHQGRRAYEMQKLPDGRILIAGGLSPNTASLNSCEIYDPVSGQWVNTSSLTYARHYFGSVVLPDGKILVIGGMQVGGPIFRQECEEFDPITQHWTSLPNMPIGCYSSAPHYSASENALYVCSGVIGGFGGTYTQNVQIFSFDSSKWIAGSPLTVGHADDELQSTTTVDESYILFGGRDSPNSTTNIVEYFDQISESWKMAGALPASHWHGMAFPIGADSFIVVGGVLDPGTSQQTLAATSWFSFKDRTSWAGNPMLSPRYLFAGLVVDLPYEDPCRGIKMIYVFGGGTPNISNSCERLVLGPRAITTALDLEPVRIQLPHSNCSTGADTSLRVFTAMCGPVDLDSVQVLIPGVTVQTPSLPLIIPGGGSVEIPVHIEAADSTRIPLRLVFRTPVGLIERFVYVTLYSGQTGRLRLSTASTQPRSVCVRALDSVLLSNFTCDSVSIVSVTFSGANATRFDAFRQTGVIPPNGSTSFLYQLDAPSPGTYTTTLVIATMANGHRDTLRQVISVEATGGTAVVGRTLMTDRRVLAGDTVIVPVKLVTTAKSSALGAQIELVYDKDLLELLPPDFGGTLADGGADYDINLTSRGASLYIPGNIRIENGTVVNLRFRTFVSKNSCTTLRLSSLLFSPDDPKFTTCVLSTNLDSATICVDPQCGDNLIRDYMNGTGPQVSLIGRGGDEIVSLNGWQSPGVQVYSELGEQVGAEIAMQKGGATIKTAGLASGRYYVRVSEAGVVRSRGFVVGH